MSRGRRGVPAGLGEAGVPGYLLLVLLRHLALVLHLQQDLLQLLVLLLQRLGGRLLLSAYGGRRGGEAGMGSLAPGGT